MQFKGTEEFGEIDASKDAFGRCLFYDPLMVHERARGGHARKAGQEDRLSIISLEFVSKPKVCHEFYRYFGIQLIRSMVSFSSIEVLFSLIRFIVFFINQINSERERGSVMSKNLHEGCHETTQCFSLRQIDYFS